MNKHAQEYLKTKPLKTFEEAVLSDIGNVRESNQDAYARYSGINGELFVVCDGMGGTDLGAEAAQLACDTIVRVVSGKWEENPAALIDRALKKANTAVFHLSKSKSKTAGTTAVLVLIRDTLLWYAHVGDSRLYYRSGERFFPLTKDHSLVQRLIDDGLISRHEAVFHPDRNVVLKSLGIEATVKPDIVSDALQPGNGDSVLICTDGLTNELDDDAIHAILSENIPPDEKVKRLVDEAKSYGGSDNITVQLIRFYNQESEQIAGTVKPKSVTPKPYMRKFITVSIFLLVLTGFVVYYAFPDVFDPDITQKPYVESHGTLVLSENNSNINPSDTTAVLSVAGADDCFFLYGNMFNLTPGELMRANQSEKLFFRVGELIVIPKKKSYDR